MGVLRGVKVINDISLPSIIYRAMLKDRYTNHGCDFTPSSLFKGVREYIGDMLIGPTDQLASKAWGSFTGTLMHKGLEDLLADEHDIITEKNLRVFFNKHTSGKKLPVDMLVGGTIDVMQKFPDGSILIWDYKTMATTTRDMTKKSIEWEEKYNMYAWVIRKHKKKVRGGIYIPIFKDWAPSKSVRNKRISDIPCPEVKLETWSDEKIETVMYDLMMEKLEWKQKVFNGVEPYIVRKDPVLKARAIEVYRTMPFCEPIRRWESEVEYKIYKTKDGKASTQCVQGMTFPENQLEQAKTLKNGLEIMLTDKDREKKIGYVLKRVGGFKKKCIDWCTPYRRGLCNINPRKESKIII